MKLDLKQIAHQPGATLPFQTQLDLSQLEWNGEYPVTQPVRVEGRVRNMAGALLLNASMATTLSLTCDRCTQPFRREKTVEFETLLATELENEENEEDIVLLDRDAQLDLDELLGDVFILNMDTKNLCSEDCAGLCPGCGVDLNHEACRCQREVDPRLAKLAQLLEQSKD